MPRVAALAVGLVFLMAQCALAASWQGHAGNAQHTAIASAPAQTLSRILWKTPIDLDPQIENGELKIHYGSPLITPADTVIIPVKTGKAGGYRIEARDHASGAVIWTLTSDYQPPVHDWTPAFGPVLTLQNTIYFAGPGGLIRFREAPDQKTGTTGAVAFYGNAAYRANIATYNRTVHISTPLTADAAGNIYFGFTAVGAPGKLVSGIARVGADGAARGSAPRRRRTTPGSRKSRLTARPRCPATRRRSISRSATDRTTSTAICWGWMRRR
jgi:hypothetical protein